MEILLHKKGQGRLHNNNSCFFDNNDSLTIQITTYEQKDSSFIRIFRNNTLIKKVFEPIYFNDLNISTEAVKVADINGDSLKDIKLIAWYMGNGTASMNVRTIYFFQNQKEHFTKISFDDKIGDGRPERDIDGDGNYEIITMTLQGYENHNYWLFNLFSYNNDNLVNVNSKDNYPILIQLLNRENYSITDKVSKDKMKQLTLTLPEGYSRK